MNKIFKIDKGTKVLPKPITMSSRARSASSTRSCPLKKKDSTYFNTYGRSCNHLADKKDNNRVEVRPVNMFIMFIKPDLIGGGIF